MLRGLRRLLHLRLLVILRVGHHLRLKLRRRPALTLGLGGSWRSQQVRRAMPCRRGCQRPLRWTTLWWPGIRSLLWRHRWEFRRSSLRRHGMMLDGGRMAGASMGGDGRRHGLRLGEVEQRLGPPDDPRGLVIGAGSFLRSIKRAQPHSAIALASCIPNLCCPLPPRPVSHASVCRPAARHGRTVAARLCVCVSGDSGARQG